MNVKNMNKKTVLQIFFILVFFVGVNKFISYLNDPQNSVTSQISQLAAINCPNGYVDVKIQPQNNSKVLLTLKNGEKVIALDKINEWFKVKTNTSSIGFINCKSVDLIYDDHIIIK